MHDREPSRASLARGTTTGGGAHTYCLYCTLVRYMMHEKKCQHPTSRLASGAAIVASDSCTLCGGAGISAPIHVRGGHGFFAPWHRHTYGGALASWWHQYCRPYGGASYLGTRRARILYQQPDRFSRPALALCSESAAAGASRRQQRRRGTRTTHTTLFPARTCSHAHAAGNGLLTPRNGSEILPLTRVRGVLGSVRCGTGQFCAFRGL